MLGNKSEVEIASVRNEDATFSPNMAPPVVGVTYRNSLSGCPDLPHCQGNEFEHQNLLAIVRAWRL